MHSPERMLLQSWLQRTYPTDVLMPVLGKRPLQKFAQGRWTWANFYHHSRNLPHLPDVAVLLNRLCVIDFDDESLAQTFEEWFPVLREVPMQTTRRGRHYFFARSELADVQGFYDSCGKVTPKVDFKTITSTTTPGVIVLAPSEGKHWVRPLWEHEGPLIPIPDALLRSVCKPLYGPIPVAPGFIRIVFPQGSCVSCATYRKEDLLQFSLFRVRIQDAPVDNLSVVKGSARYLEMLMHLSKNGELPMSFLLSSEPTADLAAYADYLGAPQRMMRYLRLGVRARRALRDVCPEMLWALAEEGACRAGGPLMEITTESVLEMRVASRSDAATASLLIQGFPTADVLLRPDSTLLRRPEGIPGQLPACVMNVLRMGAGKVALAGGAALGCVTAAYGPGRDYDLYVYGVGEGEAFDVLEGIMRCVDGSSFTTPNTVTILKDDVEIQVVMRLHPSLKDVLMSFDLPPCRVAVYFDDTGAMRIAAVPGWTASVCHQMIWADPMQHSETYVQRLLKYYTKGFDVLCPRFGPVSKNTGLYQLIEGARKMVERRTLMATGSRPLRADLRYALNSGTVRDQYPGLATPGVYRLAQSTVRGIIDWAMGGVAQQIARGASWLLEWGPLTADNVRGRCSWVVCSGEPYRPSSREWDVWDEL